MSETNDMAENGIESATGSERRESGAKDFVMDAKMSNADNDLLSDAQSETAGSSGCIGRQADDADSGSVLESAGIGNGTSADDGRKRFADEDDDDGHPASAKGPNTAPTRPEYVDFCVDDFPGGLESCLEAILMVADQPQQVTDLARVLALDEDEVRAALESMQREYDGDESRNLAPRGFELRHTALGWQFGNRAVFEPVVSAFVTDGQMARLSQAALEALAIVAYKQPVTRAQIAAIRGVNSDGVVRALSVRGLIREDGADSDSRAAFLVTTGLFLEKMGLESLDQLPELAPFMPAASDVVNQAEETSGPTVN